jgi:ketosteroid isomerase-like protein
MDDAATVRRYYETLDAGEYDALAGLLAPSFAQQRPDQVLVGRDAFVEFMRDQRPVQDTTHDLDAVYGDGDGEVLARGTVRTADGDPVVAFADVFTLADGVVERLETYTR